MRSMTLALAVVLLFTQMQLRFAAGAEATKPRTDKEQIWEGSLDVGAAVLRLRFEITRDAKGDFSGHLISVDQGNAKVPLTSMSVDGDIVKMEFRKIASKFEGKLDKDTKSVDGKWTQLGKNYDFSITRVGRAKPKQHLETWQGILTAGARKFDFQLRVEGDADGKKYGTLDNFSQRQLGLSTEFESTDEGFLFKLPAIKATYEGTYNEDRTEVEGKWKQGADLPLRFKKIRIEQTRWTLGKPNRPQHPKKPYPYHETKVTFRNSKDNVELAGTLTLPKHDDAAAKFPAVVLISGSGPQDRDETLFDHKPFLVIADHLTRKGIAVLRYDDRGVEESSGKFQGATTKDFAKDAESAVGFLLQHPSIDAAKIGLIGHSEGGVVGPQIAARRDDIAFVVMLAGPGVSGAKIAASQSRAMSEAAGLPKAYLDTQDEALGAVLDAIRKQDEPPTSDEIGHILDGIAAKSKEKKTHVELMTNSLRNLTDPWMAAYVKSDPGADLQQVRCPVLGLLGEKDLQVLPELNRGGLEKHLKAGGNKDFKIQVMPGLNHLFQTADSGQMHEYGTIEETVAPVVLKTVSDWILERIE